MDGYISRRNPCGQKTQPNHNIFPPRELRHTQNRLLSRSLPLTLVGWGNMVKFFCFTIERTMSFILQPWRVFVMILVGWVHREQHKIIEFYQTQLDAVMKAQGKKRLLLTDGQRRLLAVKGESLGRKALMQLTTIVTPDTILRWHRTLLVKKWDYSDRRSGQTGRPSIRQVIVDLILRFAKENPSWGYDRIQGALANVGYHISDTTIGNVLKQHGIEPAPDRNRQTTWKTFIKSHWEVLAAIDFTTIEVWTKGGLVTYYHPCEAGNASNHPPREAARMRTVDTCGRLLYLFRGVGGFFGPRRYFRKHFKFTRFAGSTSMFAICAGLGSRIDVAISHVR